MSENTPSPLTNVITIDDDRIKNHLDRVGSVKIFSHFDLGWRRPALAQASSHLLVLR
jgi:hypothetical protein